MADIAFAMIVKSFLVMMIAPVAMVAMVAMVGAILRVR